MKTASELKELLKSIDRRGYPAYKALQGEYRFPDYTLSIDHVQGDPFAAPSKLSIYVDSKNAAIPQTLLDTSIKRIRVQDHLTRLFHKEAERYNFKARGSGKSGLLSVSKPGQEVLERTACDIKNGSILLRFAAGLPANGRTVNAGELEKMLFDFLPACVKAALLYFNIDHKKLEQAVKLAEDQAFLRGYLRQSDLVAFIADGSILPRESGVSCRPMQNSVPFHSPQSLSVTITLPNHGQITGMGLKKGITLIVGGGYHGKSTLLKALEAGVYDHIERDGREYVITDSSAVKLRAEDGRSIRSTDISLFINHLPDGRDTRSFSTEDASGSTSQAAGLMEAIEAESRLLLIDEDTSATNFMVRDQLMQSVVSRAHEPITPFLEQAQNIYRHYGVSTILVAGSSGAFFHIADTVLQMDTYLPYDITEKAQAACKEYAAPKNQDTAKNRFPELTRTALPASSSDERIKIKLLGKDSIQYGRETIDLRYVEQLTDPEQYLALGYIVRYACEKLFDGKKTLAEASEELDRLIAAKGLAVLCTSSRQASPLALPRKQDILACLNRCRFLKIRQ